MEERFKFLSPLLFEVVILTYCFIFRTFLFLQIPTHPENHSIPLNRRISKYIYSGSLRGNGDETQDSWTPFPTTTPACWSSSLCFAAFNLIYYFFKPPVHQPIKFSPHQLEIPLISAKMEHREKERTQYEFCAFARPHGIQPSGRFE